MTTAARVPNLGIAKGPPWTTKLDPADEARFQVWVQQNKVPWLDSPTADYDMRGFWKAMTAADPRAVRNFQSQHFPDIWKTPYHETFSRESMYALPTAPRWVRHPNGYVLIDQQGRIVFDERKQP